MTGKALSVVDDGDDLPASAANFLISGPAGVLEAVLNYSQVADEVDTIAVVCHPHPLYGGSMTNKVAHTVARAFDALGVVTLRFNFRGVGHSEGEFDQGKGEAQDLLVAVDWLRARFPQARLWLAGFSFGSFVVYSAYKQADAERLLLVAPPVDMFEFAREQTVDVPWMVIQGGEDEVVSADSVTRWVERQARPPRYEYLDDAGHFFHGRLVPLRDGIVQAWG